MGKVKYDRQALKLEFFQSDIDEVYDFLKRKYGDKLAKSSMKNKCKGWGKEKQEYKDKILQKALDKKAKEEAESLEIPVDQLMRAKTELGEPTTISKNDTTVRGEPLDESLFIQN